MVLKRLVLSELTPMRYKYCCYQNIKYPCLLFDSKMHSKSKLKQIPIDKSQQYLMVFNMNINNYIYICFTLREYHKYDHYS